MIDTMVRDRKLFGDSRAISSNSCLIVSSVVPFFHTYTCMTKVKPWRGQFFHLVYGTCSIAVVLAGWFCSVGATTGVVTRYQILTLL